MIVVSKPLSHYSADEQNTLVQVGDILKDDVFQFSQSMSPFAVGLSQPVRKEQYESSKFCKVTRAELLRHIKTVTEKRRIFSFHFSRVTLATIPRYLFFR